jgi:hypothetical protein
VRRWSSSGQPRVLFLSKEENKPNPSTKIADKLEVAIDLLQPSSYGFVVLGLLVVVNLPKFGHAILAFLRDLDDYRANRHDR